MKYEEAEAINQAVRLLARRHRGRAQSLLSEVGLHPGQEMLLLVLDRDGPSIQAQLAGRLGCEPPSVTLMARKLEASGHIRRSPSPSDKRATVVELTGTGRDLVAEVKEIWRTLAAEAVAGLSEKDVEALVRTAGVAAENLGHSAPAEPGD